MPTIYIDADACPQPAGRELSRHLRELGVETRGPAAMDKQDRARFLNMLDSIIQALKREAAARAQ